MGNTVYIYPVECGSDYLLVDISNQDHSKTIRNFRMNTGETLTWGKPGWLDRRDSFTLEFCGKNEDDEWMACIHRTHTNKFYNPDGLIDSTDKVDPRSGTGFFWKVKNSDNVLKEIERKRANYGAIYFNLRDRLALGTTLPF